MAKDKAALNLIEGAKSSRREKIILFGMGKYEMKPPYDPPPMQVTAAEMKAARIPLDWRDHCAHLLIPLNKCR